MDAHTKEHLHEPPKVVTWPLIALAIPSVFIGGLTIGDMLFGDYFGSAIFVLDKHDVLSQIGFNGGWAFVQHGFGGPALYLAALGVLTAWYIYIKNPGIADTMKNKFSIIYKILDNKYYADDANEFVFGAGSRQLGNKLWQHGDVSFIDGLLVNGSAKFVGWFSGVARHIQTGMLYHYAFAMFIGVLALLTLFVLF